MNSREKLVTGRLRARELAPYLSSALLTMVPREAPGLGTFAVTPNGIMLWDPAAVEKWTIEEIAGAWLHEVWHLLRDHAGRCRALGAQAELWNIAADAEINDDLVDGKVKLPGHPITPKLLNQANGLTAEEYYHNLPRSGGAGGNGKQQGKGKGDKESKDGGKPGVGEGKCGGGAGNPGEGEPDEKDPDGRTDVEMARVRRETADQIREAAAAKGRGSVPGGWARWADAQGKPPKIPWQRKLARLCRTAVAYRPGAMDYRYDRPSRHQAAIGYGNGKPILPCLRAPVPHVAVVVDTSGSMGEAELTVGLREANGVLRAVGAAVDFISVDAAVHSNAPVRSWREMVGLLKGGGGTDFRPAFEALTRNRRRRPEVVVFVTDGMGPAPAISPIGMKVIWLIVGGRQRPYNELTHQPVTWGEEIIMDD